MRPVPDASPDAFATALAALRAPFPDDGDLHLNNAGISPLSPAADAALQHMIGLARRGTLGIGETIGRVEAARASVARLVGAAPGDVAFFQTCAAALSQIALGLELGPGDELVVLDQEYPSNAYPWMRAAELRGCVLKIVASRPDLTIDPAALLAAIGPRTRVLACSWVQYQTGTTLELPPLAEAVHANGGLLVVDAIQGLGVMPFDLAAMGADVVCGGSQKWLMGPMGLGFLAARPGLVERISPIVHGAMTYGTPDDAPDAARPARANARRFEPGSPQILSAPGTGASIDALLDAGIERLGAEARTLADRLAEGLLRRDYALFPRAPLSPIVTFKPRRPPGELSSALFAQGCAVSVRAGGLRVSPHAHNRPAHIDRFLGLLDTLDRDGNGATP